MSAVGHFRPFQRGFAMSDHPPEADITTAGIWARALVHCLLSLCLWVEQVQVGEASDLHDAD
jgi:hypothetical protein